MSQAAHAEYGEIGRVLETKQNEGTNGASPPEDEHTDVQITGETSGEDLSRSGHESE